MRIIIGFLVGSGIGAILFIIKEELINTYRYKRPKGKWIEDTGLYATCSNCKENLYQAIEYKFCPNCGADMRGDE